MKVQEIIYEEPKTDSESGIPKDLIDNHDDEFSLSSNSPSRSSSCSSQSSGSENKQESQSEKNEVIPLSSQNG